MLRTDNWMLFPQKLSELDETLANISQIFHNLTNVYQKNDPVTLEEP